MLLSGMIPLVHGEPLKGEGRDGMGEEVKIGEIGGMKMYGLTLILKKGLSRRW